jgi:hypothetical protein
MKVEPARRAELLQRYAADLMRDPVYRFLERNCNWVVLALVSWLAFFAAGLGAALATGARPPRQLNSAQACWCGAYSCAPCT